MRDYVVTRCSAFRRCRDDPDVSASHEHVPGQLGWRWNRIATGRELPFYSFPVIVSNSHAPLPGLHAVDTPTLLKLPLKQKTSLHVCVYVNSCCMTVLSPSFRGRGQAGGGPCKDLSNMLNTYTPPLMRNPSIRHESLNSVRKTYEQPIAAINTYSSIKNKSRVSWRCYIFLLRAGCVQ